MWLTILSDQLPVKSLGGPLPRQQADRTRAHLQATGLAVPVFNKKSMPIRCTIRYYHPFQDAMSGFEADYSRVTNPFAVGLNPLDLHALSTPPAFILS